tara:strand:- start:23 stop:916 length:894 start_codon:yes stop_codon:yes gene_type:complete
MARFSNKIESLKYADIEHKTIEILYKNGETINPYYIQVDYNNQDFLDLLEEYSIEDIEDQTRIYYENINMRRESEVLNRATEMFESWIKLAQIDLDRQDEERYKIFEKYKEEQLVEADAQVERRIQEGYEGVQATIDEQYKEVEKYKEEQLKILQAEVDEQVERRIAEGFADVDAYREKQLSILQKELDQQVEQRYKEADEYKDSQINIIQQEVKTDLLSKFNVPRQTTISYTPEKVAKYMIDNFKDEDTVFKTKLEIFNLPEVKNSKDREMKMKVRKAKTVPEIFAAYHDIQCNHS